MNPTQVPLPDRLKKGAQVLGHYWKVPGERCLAGWSLEACSCQPQKKFCQARVQWLTLAVEAGRDLQDGPHGMVLALTASEWDATGLTLKVAHLEVGEFLVGSSKESVTGMTDLGRMMEAPDVLASTLRVLKAFPRSKVQGLEGVVSEGAATEGAPIVATVTANPDEAFE